MDIDFQYDLGPKSVVFDVGGYKGEFAAFIRNKYRCGVHVFEPCREFFAGIVKRFEQDPMIWPYNIALEDRDYEAELWVQNDSTSIHHKFGDQRETIRVRDIVPFIGAFKLTHIDLLKMNCEGSEYPILKRLHTSGWLEKIRNIAVQFHPSTEWDRQTFESTLSITHSIGHKCDHWQWWKIR
jgi:FkbM family methyltransferase